MLILKSYMGIRLTDQNGNHSRLESARNKNPSQTKLDRKSVRREPESGLWNRLGLYSWAGELPGMKSMKVERKEALGSNPRYSYI